MRWWPPFWDLGALPTGMCSTYVLKLGHIFIRNVDHRACIAQDRPEGHGRAVHLLLAAAWQVQDSHLGQESLCLKNLLKGKDASRWRWLERASTAPCPSSEDGGRRGGGGGGGRLGQLGGGHV